AGMVVSAEELDLAIVRELSDFKADTAIKLVIVEEKPDNLTFDEFAEQYVREPKDAVYTKDGDTHNIEPEVVGIELDLDEARRIFEENKDSTEPYEIPAVITKPEITAKYLEDKYVNKIMASYSTSYAGSSSGRCVNIALAASKIDGYVVNPGGRFSYNAVVGPRTEAAGFKSAHVYVGTQVVDGIGGGICQVSSTLYNAVVLADLKTVTRVNHSMPVNYVPLGRDATVSYGTIDYVFENNKPYPISIKAKTSGTTLTISIVGTSDMDYTVDFVTKFVSSVPYGTTTEEDASLAEGEKKVLSPGTNGSVYESYRVYKRGGVEYDRKFESRSRYQPVAAKVAVGTKKADEPKPELPPAEPAPEVVVPPEPEDTDIPEGDINDEIIHPEENTTDENQTGTVVEPEE
ncbi:MAG: VanW family protein, partial [Clostridia bacterium]|nr:VanW family protein [Clostridia bacterium]